MDVATHKVTGKMIVCLAAQSQTLADKENFFHYLFVFEIDVSNGYSMRTLLKHRSDVPQITKVIYAPDCGLIMACFAAYVEIFDCIDFHSKLTWHNDVPDDAPP